MGSTVIFDSASRVALGRRVTQTALRDFAAILEVRVAKKRSFDCLITGDAELRRLNKQFLRKNYPTDVLSFPTAVGTLPGYLNPKEIHHHEKADESFPTAVGTLPGYCGASFSLRGALAPPVLPVSYCAKTGPQINLRGASAPLGELAISADRALEQAREHGHALADELKILMLHGVLHLTGLDHESDLGEMARAETRWRKLLQLPNGLIERTTRS